MRANADKFQLIFLGKNIRSCDHTIYIDNMTLKGSSAINVLGVELDEDLNFHTHVEFVCSETAKQINAMSRINNYLDNKSRKFIYNSFIVSNFNYCSTVWMFTNRRNLNRLDKLNKRALRLVYNDKTSPYNDILHKYNCNDVYKMCTISLAVEVFKMRHQTAPPYLSNMLEATIPRYDFRDQSTYILPKFNTKTYGFHSLRYIGSKLWNYLDFCDKNTESLSQFKSNVKNWIQRMDTVFIKSEFF